MRSTAAANAGPFTPAPDSTSTLKCFRGPSPTTDPLPGTTTRSPVPCVRRVDEAVAWVLVAFGEGDFVCVGLPFGRSFGLAVGLVTGGDNFADVVTSGCT